LEIVQACYETQEHVRWKKRREAIMRRIISNEKGVALVTALMLTLISLAIIMSILFLVTQGTKLSASQKRYHNALEASYGGVEFFTKDLLSRLILSSMDLSGSVFTDNLATLATTFDSVALTFPGTANDQKCFGEKLSKSTENWTYCTNDKKTVDPKTSSDITFHLSGTSDTSGYNVYGKIIDTQEGNTDLSGAGGGSESGLKAGGVVDVGGGGGGGVINPGKHYPYLYTLELQGEKDISPDERARLTVLYAY
jgi:Flp pilus assembly pilin Flp